jgi:ribosomal protein L11 methyltransferase
MMDRVAKGRSPDRKATGPTPSLFAVSVEAEADTLRMLEQSFPDEPAAITWIGENAEGPGRLDWFRSFRLEAETMAGSVRSRLAAADLTVPVTVREIPAEDWSESWKRHFPVIRVSERLVVAPPWSELEETPGLCVVRIEPGLSFGTGQHGTTKACLFFLDRLQHRLPEAVVLDLGCGSGILAIAAAKLGFPRVLALDHDPEAVRVARENTAANGVADRIEVAVAEVERDRPFPPCRIVVANILATVLIASASAVRASLSDQPGSTLVLSGILACQYEDVRRAYIALGLRETQRLTLEGWTTGGFETTA